MKPKYSLIIRWSEEDQCYLAWIPEFGTAAKTHGSTYEEAARAGREVIESLMEPDPRSHLTVPTPWLFSDIASDEALGHYLFPTNPAYKEPAIRRTNPVKHATA